MKALIMVASFSRLAARAVKNFVEECAPTESGNRSPRERGESRAYSPSEGAEDGRCLREIRARRLVRARGRVRVRGSVIAGALGRHRCLLPAAPNRRNPRSQARLIFLITHARVLRIRDSRFSFQSGASIKIQPV